MLAILSVAIVLVYAALPSVLDRSTRAPERRRGPPAALRLISSIGQTGGFVSPYLIGLIKSQTGRLDCGLYLMSILLCLGALVLFVTVRDEPKGESS